MKKNKTAQTHGDNNEEGQQCISIVYIKSNNINP